MDDEQHTLRAGKRKHKISKKKMSNYFTEYCNATSIHGFRYLGEQDRSCLEKFWWLLTIMVSLVVCIFLIIETYKKWIRSPVIVTFATKQTPIWQIPFPAVTICPENKALASIYNISAGYYNFTTDYKDMSKEMRENFEKISLICQVNINNQKLKFHTNYTNSDTINFMMRVGPNMSSIFKTCKWRGLKVDCTKHFTPILTDEGICYTFNMLDRSDIYKEEVWQYKDFLTSAQDVQGWTLEKGYGADLSKDSYPQRALYSGAKAGLDIEFIHKADDLSYACGEALQGFKVLLHSPDSLPRVSEQYFRVPLSQAVVASIKPDMMTTSRVLKNYDPMQRLCYFSNEKQLKFFKTYTQLNCETECLANFTLQKCGCVDFHMPKLNDTKICGAAQLECMNYAESQLLSDEIDAKLKREEEELDINQNKTEQNIIVDNIINILEIPKTKKKLADILNDRDCNCLPSCQSLAYSVETSQSDWKWYKQYADFAVDDQISYNTRDYRLAKLLIFFKDNQFVSSERDELVNGADFLANCGGLLGLFTGFSFISLVEIIYFLSLRFICNIRKYGRKNWSGTNN